MIAWGWDRSRENANGKVRDWADATWTGGTTEALGREIMQKLDQVFGPDFINSLDSIAFALKPMDWPLPKRLAQSRHWEEGLIAVMEEEESYQDHEEEEEPQIEPDF